MYYDQAAGGGVVCDVLPGGRLALDGTLITQYNEFVMPRSGTTITTVETKYSLYDGLQVMCDLDGNGDITKRYVYALGKCIGMIDSAGHRYLYHHDVLGSIRLVVDTTGVVVNSYTYYPFGDSLNYSGTLKNELQFTSKSNVPGMEAYDFSARYYDPAIGRFYSIDPLFNPATSPYAYCDNNPVSNNDPTGMAIEKALTGYDPDCETHGLGGYSGSTSITNYSYDPFYGGYTNSNNYWGKEGQSTGINWVGVVQENGDILPVAYYVSKLQDASGASFNTFGSSHYNVYQIYQNLYNGTLLADNGSGQATVDAMENAQKLKKLKLDITICDIGAFVCGIATCIPSPITVPVFLVADGAFTITSMKFTTQALEQGYITYSEYARTYYLSTQSMIPVVGIGPSGMMLYYDFTGK